MNDNRVSVVVPCYNVEAYIRRFLDSLLAQTYKKLEIVFVNDGSTDQTGELIKEYIPLLENEGYKIVYLEQENGGQSAAINAGIKLASGKFMTWPDPDDWLTPDSIEKRVHFLMEHPEVAMVRCNIEKVQDGTMGSLGLFERNFEQAGHITDFYEKLKKVKTWVAPLAYMVRMSHFDAVNPERDIYTCRKGGQNLQMLLPLARKFPCWQMPDVLGYYLIRGNSHSRNQNTFADRIAYKDLTEDVVINTLIRMGADKAELKCIEQQFAWKRVLAAKRHGTWPDVWFYARKAWPIVDEKIVLILALFLPRFVFRFFKKMIPCVSK